jgi:hypothetical protein
VSDSRRQRGSGRDGSEVDASRFLPGQILAERFYWEAVRPVLDMHYPALVHSAALLGSGSEVLGCDTPLSMDHDWAPRGLLFLSEEDEAAHGKRIGELLGRELPHEFLGHPVDLLRSGHTATAMTRPVAEGQVQHAVNVQTVAAFCRCQLGFDPRIGMNTVDWLVVPQQRLLGVSAGRVFYDGLSELGPLRERLRYYPDDVWLALLAAQWRRIDQEEPLMARCGDVGDDLGSRVVAARQARELMRLCFLIERRYWPYTKWFATAFSKLDCAARVGPHLAAALAADDWHARERSLGEAYVAVAEMHNELGVSDPVPVELSPFHDRPYLVIHAGRFFESLRDRIREPILAEAALTGCVDQFADSTDVLSYPLHYARFRHFFTTVPDAAIEPTITGSVLCGRGSVGGGA